MINLKKLREEKGLTQKQLVDMTRIAQGTISAYETKYRTIRNPKPEYIKKLAEALGVNPEEISEIKEKKEGEKAIKCTSKTCPFAKKGKCDNDTVINSIAPCYRTSSDVKIIKRKNNSK